MTNNSTSSISVFDKSESNSSDLSDEDSNDSNSSKDDSNSSKSDSNSNSSKDDSINDSDYSEDTDSDDDIYKINWTIVILIEYIIKQYNKVYKKYNNLNDFRLYIEEKLKDIDINDHEALIVYNSIKNIKYDDTEISIWDTDFEILEFLMEHVNDIKLRESEDQSFSFSYILDKIYGIRNSSYVSHKNLHIRSIETTMVNFNYALDFPISRRRLCEAIEKYTMHCRARYNPLYDPYIVIYFPIYDTSLEYENIKDILKYFTITLYPEGKIIQSGRTIREAMEIRQWFLSLIDALADYIRTDI
jgi:hypothetical protein